MTAAGHRAVAPLATALADALPRLTPEEQRLGLAVYRTLVAGRPVALATIAEALGTRVANVRARLLAEPLRSYVLYDERHRVRGFGGLAVFPTPHRLVMHGRTLCAWCAWDALFLPGLLGAPAQVASRCPVTGATARVSVRPDGIVGFSPPQVRLSFREPVREGFCGDPGDTIARFCDAVRLLASPEAGVQWTRAHARTVLLTVEQAFALGCERNRLLFPTHQPVAGTAP